MKYPILFGGLLGGTILFSTIILALVFPIDGFLKEPLSTIVNIPNIMPYFTVFGTIIGLLLALFIYSAFKEFGEPDIKIKSLMITTTILGMIMVWAPYNDYQLIFKIIHTITALGVAINLIILAIKFDKISSLSSKVLSIIKKKIPQVMGIGTLGIMILTGINLVMEIYFFALAMIWLIIVGVTIKEKEK